MPAQGSLPVDADASAGRSLNPVAVLAAQLISEALDANEHTRNELIRMRGGLATSESGRVRVDRALGRLAQAHRQLNAALRDIEQAGGAE